MSILKYQKGDPVQHTDSMTPEERAILTGKLDVANKANYSSFVGQSVTPEQQKRMTTQYKGKFSDNNITKSSGAWEGQQRESNNKQVTTNDLATHTINLVWITLI